MLNSSRYTRLDVFLFAHQEGNWLGSSVTSVDRSTAFAATKGLACTKSIILRAPNNTTSEWIKENLGERWSTLRLNDGSFADARNAASDLAEPDSLVAFIDGSDIIGEEWLYQAAITLEQLRGICRPQGLITFGPDSFSQDGFEFILQPETAPTEPAILKGNPYPSGFVTTSDIVKAVKWPQVDGPVGWGLEDWWWNCITIENEIPQNIVSGAAHFRRMSVRPALANNSFRPGPIRK